MPRLDKKLAGYTLIGAAAFTVTGIAHADDITYVPNVNLHVDGNDATPSYTLNVGPGSITITAAVPPGGNPNYGGTDNVSISPSSTAFILTDGAGAEALGGNVVIDATSSGWGIGGLMTNTYEGKFFTKTAGDWSNSGKNAYLGFYFQDTDGTHTGWVDITTWSSPTDASFTVDGYAYENTPNTAIRTTPEPSTLSLLAMGSVGLLEMRRRRRTNA